jgi:hypothetical protein
MSEVPSLFPQNESALQFDRADSVEETSRDLQCSTCATPFHDHYYEANGQTVCERCRYEVEREFAIKPGAAGFTKAFGAGLGAAAVGAGIYYAVLALTGYEFGLIAILVGFMVGSAVRWSSRGRGGWAYQSLAIVLTYMAIVSTYIPLMIQEMTKNPTVEAAATAAPGTTTKESQEEFSLGAFVVGVMVLFALAAALPFFAGIENAIGLLIIGIALYEAWKLNKRATLEITGPYRVGEYPAGETVSEAVP